ncbi:MAG: hypothetical protein HZA08_07320 [Nitrospirae bacterium]|nr:hypothetical protein [Nitrospirota bacterium]
METSKGRSALKVVILHAIKHVLDGAGQVMVICPNREYVRPSRRDISKDNLSLKKDSGRVARDLLTTISRYGK